MQITEKQFKHYRIPLLAGALGMSGVFLFSWLTFVPERTFAESLIVDPNEKRSLSDIATMQEMSQQICINSYEEETKQLRDTRDNKTYWATKLKDGNCWMTQNLDYDGGGVKTQDLSMWDGKTENGHVSVATAAYYDPDAGLSDGNKYYYNGPDGNHGWSSDECLSNANGLASCVAQGFEVAMSGDNHYLVGNYYSWPAATTTSGGAGQSMTSVCPIGWKLPSGGTGVGEFRELMLKYGWATDNPSNIAVNMNNGKGIYGAPLYFVYGGRLVGGTLYIAGRFGTYWSSSSSESITDRAYNFAFHSGVNPFDVNNRSGGFSVRCLAIGGWLEQYITDQSNVAIKVSPTISLDVTADAVVEDATFTSVSTSNIKANVSSNHQYVVSLSTAQPNLELAVPVAGQNIPMIRSGEEVKAGVNGWGIMQKMSALDNTMLGSTVDNVNNVYSPVGIGDEQVVFYKSAGPEALTDQADPANPLVLKVGVGVSPQLLSGTYSTMVTLTASTY